MKYANANSEGGPVGQPVPHVTAEALIYVLEGWLGQDDWGIETFPYPSTVADLLAALHSGDSPRALRMAGTTLGWKADVVARYAPAFTLAKRAERQVDRLAQARANIGVLDWGPRP